MEPIDTIWTEKYRPKYPEDVIGTASKKVLKYLENSNAMPHLMFESKTPGTGKTTLAKAIINKLGCDALILNSSDDRKIDVIREKVKRFSLTKSSKDGLRRCVFLDEFDGMLKASQDALRNVMETYASNVFFILTCNNANKIIDALKSRCVVIPFAYPEKKDIYKYLETICVKENLIYDEAGLKLLINLNYPSIRNCVKTLQDINIEEKSVIVENVQPINEEYKLLWEDVKTKNWKKIKEVILSTSIDPRELNFFFWNKAFSNEDLNIKVLQICCRNERDIANGADPKVIVATSLIEMVK